MHRSILTAMDLENIGLLKEYPKQRVIHLFSIDVGELLEGV